MRTAKASPFGRGGIASAMTERASRQNKKLSLSGELICILNLYCTACSAAAIRYSDGVCPVRRLNTRVK